jgi:hypothetical protein
LARQGDNHSRSTDQALLFVPGRTCAEQSAAGRGGAAGSGRVGGEGRMDAAFRKLTHALMLIGGMGIVLMMAHVTLDVVLKNLFNAPIQGTIEISSYYYMVAVVMLPMAMVEYEGVVAELRLEAYLPLSPMRSSQANDLGGAES